MSVQLHFLKRVTTHGTAVALSAVDLIVHQFSVIALRANTGLIYSGGFDVSAANPGESLAPGDRENFAPKRGVYNLKYFYIDSDVDNEGVAVKFYPAIGS